MTIRTVEVTEITCDRCGSSARVAFRAGGSVPEVSSWKALYMEWEGSSGERCYHLCNECAVRVVDGLVFLDMDVGLGFKYRWGDVVLTDEGHGEV